MLSHIFSLTSEDLMQRESAYDSFFMSSRVCAALRVILNLTIEKRGEIRTPERNITPPHPHPPASKLEHLKKSQSFLFLSYRDWGC